MSMTNPMTKRTFLKGLGGIFAAKSISKASADPLQDTAQADRYALKELAQQNLNYPISSPSLNCPDVPKYFELPYWQAKIRVDQKRHFLRDTNPSRNRSGQFTSHAQKKERWLQKREYRRFMGNYRMFDGPVIETIQQWKLREQAQLFQDMAKAAVQQLGFSGLSRQRKRRW